MKRLLALLFIVFTSSVYAQSSKLASEIFNLINEARTKPQQFLKSHQTAIEKYESKYINILKTAKPIPAVIWDKGLEAMAKASVDDNNLNPTYKGKNELCGQSSGTSSASFQQEAISFVCDIYTNINNKTYKYIGIYYNKDKNNGYSFVWGKSCDKEKVKFTFNEKIDSSAVDFKSLNTAANVNYMNAAEKRMVLEINFVRKYPKIYAKIIAKHLAEESKSVWGLSYDDYFAGMELINELKAMKPLNVLQAKQCIYNAAKLHGLDCKKRGYFAHTGSDGSDPWDRILKQCSELTMGNENGAGGSGTARDRTISLLLDSGISSRGHRYNILDEKWKFVACYRYPDATYKFYWIQNFGY